MIPDHELNSEPSYTDLRFGDAAFETLFKSHFTSLCAYCQFKFGFELQVAKEVVHTGFIKLWETRHKVSPSLSIKSYLYKIITNNCLDILRHEKVKHKYEKMVLNDITANAYINEFQNIDIKKMAQDIDQAVAELPGQMRKIFELSRYSGMKYTAIAERLGISVKTVETQMSRALAKLKERLAQYLISLLVILFIS